MNIIRKIKSKENARITTYIPMVKKQMLKCIKLIIILVIVAATFEIGRTVGRSVVGWFLDMIL